MQHEGKNVWGVHDLADAFGSIPHGRLIQILRATVPNCSIANLLVQLVERKGRRPGGLRKNRGVPQGCPTSPFFLNIYLAHFLDRPWAQQHPGTPIIRYADDLLLLDTNLTQT